MADSVIPLARDIRKSKNIWRDRYILFRSPSPQSPPIKGGEYEVVSNQGRGNNKGVSKSKEKE
jgi:hypothetical protein